MGSTHATLQHHPHGAHNASGLRNHDHRTTFYGGKHGQGSGNPQSLSLPRSSIASHIVSQQHAGHGHQRDASVHLTKRSGFSYF